MLIKCVLNHESMPKSRFIPNHGTVVDHDVISYDESNAEIINKKIPKYLPSQKSPLGIYLTYVKKMTLQGGTWSNKEMIVPINSPLQLIGLYLNENINDINIEMYR